MPRSKQVIEELKMIKNAVRIKKRKKVKPFCYAIQYGQSKPNQSHRWMLCVTVLRPITSLERLVTIY